MGLSFPSIPLYLSASLPHLSASPLSSFPCFLLLPPPLSLLIFFPFHKLLLRSSSCVLPWLRFKKVRNKTQDFISYWLLECWSVVWLWGPGGRVYRDREHWGDEEHAVPGVSIREGVGFGWVVMLLVDIGVQWAPGLFWVELTSMETRKEHQISGMRITSSRNLSSVGVGKQTHEPRSSAKSGAALNPWAISPHTLSLCFRT